MFLTGNEVPGDQLVINKILNLHFFLQLIYLQNKQIADTSAAE